MSLSRIFVHAFVRRIAFVLAALVLAYLGLGRANAAQLDEPSHEPIHSGSCTSSSPPMCSFSQAMKACTLAKQEAGSPPGLECDAGFFSDNRIGLIYNGSSIQQQYRYGTNCPVGETWNANTHTCHNPDECLAKNESLGNAISVYDSDTHGCNEGCAMSMGTDYVTDTITAGGQTRTLFRGKMRYTGAACSNEPDKKKPDEKPECFGIAGQSICKRPDGQLCQLASTGNYICWKPGQTGEQTDGPDKQRNDPGTQPQPPTQPPSGDTLITNGPPVTQTTTNNITNHNTTTTNSSYTTTNGTNAGPTNNGVPPGSGGGVGPDTGTGDGEGDGDGDAAGAIKDLHDDLKGGPGEGTTPDPGSVWDGDGEDAEVNSAGYGLSRSCPSPPTITVGGMTRTIDTSGLCDLGEVIAALVLLMAAAHFIYAFTR